MSVSQVVYMSNSFRWFIVLFRCSILLLIFCLVVHSINKRGILKALTIIEYSFPHSVLSIFCFIYFGSPFLRVYIYNCYIFLIFFITVQLIYNVVPIFAIQLDDPITHTHTHIYIYTHIHSFSHISSIMFYSRRLDTVHLLDRATIL